MDNYIDIIVNNFKKKYSILADKTGDHIFTDVCLKYYFYNTSDNPFDIDDIESNRNTDGSNDGGFDAVINDPNSELNDMIIVQSKYYHNTVVNAEMIIGEISKISNTITKIQNGLDSDVSQKSKHAFALAKEQMQDGASIKVVFFTSFVFDETNKKSKKQVEKRVNEIFSGLNLDVAIYWGDEVEGQIKLCEEQKMYVEHDKLDIDKPNNCLEYEDSVILNVSAKSLHDLYTRRMNSLLGANLRYYIYKKDVDSKIKESLNKNINEFWYKNNGILIICDSYSVSGKVLHLDNFSIINGGQTTTLIGKADIPNDFYVQCKIVKVPDSIKGDVEKRDDFVNNIAVATNSQKAIKPKDLKSNTTEQGRLREELSYVGIYYKIKTGDDERKIDKKKYNQPYQISNPDKVGIVGFASFLQMPIEARNKTSLIYNDTYYHRIFKDNALKYPGAVADLLKINALYDKFYRNNDNLAGLDTMFNQPAVRCGRTVFLALIMLFSKLSNNHIDKSTLDEKRNIGQLETLSYIETSVCEKRLLKNNLDDEETKLKKLFYLVGKRILGPCFKQAYKTAELNGETLDASGYLKGTNVYFDDILPAALENYYDPFDDSLRKEFEELLVIKNS